MYVFKIEHAQKLSQDLISIVPIKFQIDNSMSVNALMDFDEQSQNVIIKFKSSADEQIDLMHDLLHVRMQFKDKFSLLAWQTNDSRITDEIRNAVSNMRDIVDDTYIFNSLYNEFDIFPISPNFFNECKKDIQDHKINHIQSITGINKILVGSWRLRIAQLVLNDFSLKIDSYQKEICEEFLSLFSNIDIKINTTLSFLESHITYQSVITPLEHGQALDNLKDHIGFSPSLLHLASRNKINNRWLLQRI